MPVNSWLRQFTRSPFRQNSQYPQEPPRKPTPTRWPTAQPWTPGPRASIRPTASCPGTRGQSIGNKPSTVAESEWQTPHASTRIRTWPGPGSATRRSTTRSSLGAETSTAVYVSGIGLRVVPLPGELLMSCFLSEELLLNAPDWIGCDEAIRPEPRKRCNWMMVGETLVLDRATIVVLIRLGSSTKPSRRGIRSG